MNSLFLPRVSVGTDAYDAFADILPSAGTTCAIYYGEHAWKAAGGKVLSAMSRAGIRILEQQCYGKEASFENAQRIIDSSSAASADFLLAVGGGKCMDTVKYAGFMMHKPVFTCPTIASNCAPVTRISIMYTQAGVFQQIVQLSEPPRHCFIDLQVAAEAPACYLWAGMGDTMAKHVEAVFSARGDELAYGPRLGVKASELCYGDILAYGARALADANRKQTSFALEIVVQDIIITTGLVSVSVGADYNSALAHALYYGLSVRRDVAEHHLHGEIVSYGTLVQLMMDAQTKMFEEVYAFNRSIGLPLKLADLGLDVNSDLSDVLEVTANNQELIHVPYSVTKEKILQAMKRVEQYRLDDRDLVE